MKIKALNSIMNKLLVFVIMLKGNCVDDLGKEEEILEGNFWAVVTL